MEMYELTDIYIKYLFNEYVELFDNFKSALLRKDEINVLMQVNRLYEQVMSITTEKLLELAQLQYEYIMQGDYDYSGIDNAWLQEIFENFDSTVKYIFENELDRKRSRMYEAVMSSDTPNTEVDTSLKHLCKMVSQEAITVTDEATHKAYKDMGESRLRWVSEKDSKRCDECAKLHGKVFDIDKVPHKPHPNCCCYTVPER